MKAAGSPDFADLITEYRTKHPPLWNTLREVLSVMCDAAGIDGLFDFEFSDPEDYTLHVGNHKQLSLKADVMNRTNGAQNELASLSSGEKILTALCLLSFNQRFGRHRPKLLLLDELDAVLYPSMAAAFMTTLKSV